MEYGGGHTSKHSTEIFQVAFSTLERSKICLGCQYPNRYIGEVHLNKGQSGELRLNISYACRALSFSSSDTGDGCSMCQRKRSASLPVRIGVSLIGLAIIVIFLFSAAKIRISEQKNKYYLSFFEREYLRAKLRVTNNFRIIKFWSSENRENSFSLLSRDKIRCQSNNSHKIT